MKFLGYVSDEELSVLYSSCFAFIYPSYYEGFGLPVLEAQSLGVSVLTSNCSSLPEVSGDGALFVDPESVDDITRGMKEIIDNTELRKKLIEAGRKNLSRFSTKDTLSLRFE